MVILDIETTATEKRSCVLSIGAINFNPAGTITELKHAPKFHRYIELSHQIKEGRLFDPGTIRWLHKQPTAVIANANRSALTTNKLKDVMEKLILWIQDQGGFDGNCHVRGVDFEGAILPDICSQYGLVFPVNFSGYNDIRTLIRDYLGTTSSYIPMGELSPEALELYKKQTKHIAIDDCIIDAIQIIEGRRIRDSRIIGEYLNKSK